VSPLVIIEFVIQNPLPQKRLKHLRVSARFGAMPLGTVTKNRRRLVDRQPRPSQIKPCHFTV
ncbi:MAG: hypothetical protein P8J90_08990, partial [Luminiphilus sp.]|nr:hypothetical protein [Luminiphilus sp.]